MKVFLVMNSDGLPVKACSTLGKAFDFSIAHKFNLDGRELNHIVEMSVDGETWGIIHSFEEIDEYEED